jgi:uncharacterized SAM-binding protein YcdF (DUF218 family)
MSPGLRPRSLAPRVILAALVMAGIPGMTVAVATAGLFVWPRTDEPRAADAVVVLSGDYGERLLRGLELMARRLAPTLVLDGEPDFQAVADLCTARMDFEVVCLRPRPDRTRTEAAAAARLAAERGWRRMILVTSTSHVTRAGLLFRRCTDREVDVVGATPLRGPRTRRGAILYEWLALTRSVVVERSC